jgi:hypothetical protein
MAEEQTTVKAQTTEELSAFVRFTTDLLNVFLNLSFNPKTSSGSPRNQD